MYLGGRLSNLDLGWGESTEGSEFIQASHCEVPGPGEEGVGVHMKAQMCGRAWFHGAYWICSCVYRALKHVPGIMQGSQREGARRLPKRSLQFNGMDIWSWEGGGR